MNHLFKLSSEKEKHSTRFSNNINAKKILVAFILVMSSWANCLRSQTETIAPHQFEINAGASVSGNGYGGIYSGGIVFINKQHSFNVSLNIQKRTMKARGAKFQYAYKFATSDDEKTNLEFFGSLQYLDNLPLSFTIVSIEERADIEHIRNWNNLKLSAVEMAVGFGLNCKISRHLLFKNYIGIGPYYHTKHVEAMYHERSGIVLSLNTSLSLMLNNGFGLNKKKK
jgi:hypothetical protein